MKKNIKIGQLWKTKRPTHLMTTHLKDEFNKKISTNTGNDIVLQKNNIILVLCKEEHVVDLRHYICYKALYDTKIWYFEFLESNNDFSIKEHFKIITC